MTGLGSTLILVAVLARADAPRSEGDQQDLNNLKGAWACVTVHRSGVKVPAQELKTGPDKLTFAGDKLSIRMGDKTISGKVTVDTSKKPRTIDFVPDEGPNKGKTIQGIYELEKDGFNLCYDRSGASRPKNFDTKDNPDLVALECKREK